MRDSPDNLSEFPTRDIYLATILKLSKIPLLRVENQGGLGIFIFESSPELDQVTMEYFNGKLKFEPQSLFETWKALKAMVYSKTNNLRQ